MRACCVRRTLPYVVVAQRNYFPPNQLMQKLKLHENSPTDKFQANISQLIQLHHLVLSVSKYWTWEQNFMICLSVQQRPAICFRWCDDIIWLQISEILYNKTVPPGVDFWGQFKDFWVKQICNFILKALTGVFSYSGWADVCLGWIWQSFIPVN